MHGVGSRNKLTPWHAQFYPSNSLLDVLGRTVCGARCLPRKELHEAWEMATRVRAHLGENAGARIVELASGYGLLATVMLLLDDEAGANESVAVAVDVKLPPNHRRVHDVVTAAFPRLRGRQTFVQARLESFALHSADVVVSAHACGGLSDTVIARAADVSAAVAVLPCCHEHRFRADLDGVADKAAAIDDERAATLRARGYDAQLTTIPHDVSHKNRLILGRLMNTTRPP